jgi:hypothetical protein
MKDGRPLIHPLAHEHGSFTVMGGLRDTHAVLGMLLGDRSRDWDANLNVYVVFDMFDRQMSM